MRTPMRRIALLVAVLAIMFTIVGSLAGGATPAHACTTGSGTSNPCGGTAPAPAPQDADNGPARCQYPSGATDMNVVAGSDPVYVPAGATVKGAVLFGTSSDVTNGKWIEGYYKENDGTYGNAVHMLSGGWVWPKQWGGNASCTRTDASIDHELLTVGCTGGCAHVKNYFYQNGMIWEWYTAPEGSPNSGGNSPAPAPSPANTPVPQTPASDECIAGHVSKGDPNNTKSHPVLVKKGCVVTGDAEFRQPGGSENDYRAYHDNNENTAAAVLLMQDAEVWFPWGGAWNPGDLDQIASAEADTGCWGPAAGGCPGGTLKYHFPAAQFNGKVAVPLP